VGDFQGIVGYNKSTNQFLYVGFFDNSVYGWESGDVYNDNGTVSSTFYTGFTNSGSPNYDLNLVDSSGNSPVCQAELRHL
jgi:hypothetical protein